jgi:hypothetical protein
VAATVKLDLTSGGQLDVGLNCVRGVTKWKNSEIGGTWNMGCLGFMDNVNKSRI